jgi:hypothetical protein
MSTNGREPVKLTDRSMTSRGPTPRPDRPRDSQARAERYEALEGSGPVLWRSLRRRWHLLLIAGIVGGLVGYAVSDLRPEVFEAESLLLLSERPYVDGGGALRPDAMASLVELHSERIATPETMEIAAEELGIEPGVIAEAITTKPDVPALAVGIVASDQDADRAAAIADEVAVAYATTANGGGRAAQDADEVRLQRRLERLDTRIDEASAALEARPTDPVATQQLNGLVSQRLELQMRLDEVEDARVAAVVSGVLPATVPPGPSSPLPGRDAVLAALAAALAMAAVIWLRTGHVNEPRSAIGEVVDAPLLAELPSRTRMGRAPDRRVGEMDVTNALRLVNEAIRRVDDGRGAVVLFTGVDRAHDRRWIAEQTAASAATDSTREVSVLSLEHRSGHDRWSLRRKGRSGTWVAAEGLEGSDVTTTVEPVRELSDARAAGSLLLVAGPDARSPEFANLALMSDAVILVVSSKDSVSELLRLRRLLDVIAGTVLGYVYSERPG